MSSAANSESAMDTPEKTPIETPISKFEESPFSNFINSLSPINHPSKTMNMSQTLGSLHFTSPPSVFTSPQISLQKESRFIRRHQLKELAKLDLSSEIENHDSITEGGKNAANCPTNSTNEVKGGKPSKDEGSSDAQCEVSDLIAELPLELKYECSSPNLQTECGTSSCVPLLKETDRNIDGSGCDWGNMISDAADLVAFESPQDSAALKEPSEQSVNEQIDLFTSLLTHFPEDDGKDQEEQHDASKNQVGLPAEAAELKQIYQMQDNSENSSSGNFTGQMKKLENKPFVHHGMRRRCLVFEISGARRNTDGALVSTFLSPRGEAHLLANNNHSTIGQGGDSPICIRPGIGLHLNALAAASKEHRVLNPDNHSSEKQIGPILRSSESFPSPRIGSESFKTLDSIPSEDHVIVENELLNAGDASQASASGTEDDLYPISPKKKRSRSEDIGEGEPCKRCNCKKSKCLKLYCECFAAGVYCIEPCACIDCFNKPIHEETVLATRKQIESRNPLAFAPKVVMGTNSTNDLGDDSNRTPASARHKRGCNCKKSNCLKKYCECFQGGVGCSIGCRCEGCKNTFGRRRDDGSTSIEMELNVEEDTLAPDISLGDKTLLQPRTHSEEDLNPGSMLPKTPLLFRSSKENPPRLLDITSSSLLSRYGSGRSTFLRSQHKTADKLTSEDEFPAVLQNTCSSSSSSSIKTLSPNSKRISPPHHHGNSSPKDAKSSRKLILQSISSFPSLTPRR